MKRKGRENMIKEEFIKHGWEIRNEFEFDGSSYYDAVKGKAKLGVAERKIFTEIIYKDKHIAFNRLSDFTWEYLCEGMKRIIETKKQDEERAIEKHRKAIEKYEEMERMFEYGH